MLSCDTYQELLFIPDQLRTPGEQTELGQHLSRCQDCAARAARLHAELVTFQAEEGPKVPAEVVPRVWNRVAAEGGRHPRKTPEVQGKHESFWARLPLWKPLRIWASLRIWKHLPFRKHLPLWKPLRIWAPLRICKHLPFRKHLPLWKPLRIWKHLPLRKHLPLWKPLRIWAPLTALTGLTLLVILPQAGLREKGKALSDRAPSIDLQVSIEAGQERGSSPHLVRHGMAITRADGLLFQFAVEGLGAMALVERSPEHRFQVLFHRNGLDPTQPRLLPLTGSEGQLLRYTPDGPPGEYVYLAIGAEDTLTLDGATLDEVWARYVASLAGPVTLDPDEHLHLDAVMIRLEAPLFEPGEAR